MRLIIIIFFIWPSITYGQPDSAVRYSQVKEIEGLNKIDLYDKAKLWVVNEFHDSKSVIQLDNRENGQLLCKGNFTTFFSYKNITGVRKIFGVAEFTLNLMFKDGKYKAEIYSIKFIGDETSSFGTITSSPNSPEKWPMVSQRKMDEMWLDLKKNIESGCLAILKDLETAITNKKNPTDF